MFSIDIRSREPIYEQLVKNITNLITNKVLQADEPLPSVRALARDLGINPNTVQKAYRELEVRGMIYQSAGRGSFVSPNKNLIDAVKAQKLDSVSKAVTAAKSAGVSQKQLIELIDSIFEEAEK